MNEIMKFTEINENDERRDALRDPIANPVPRNPLGRSCKATKLSVILSRIKHKIKSLPKRT